MGSPTSEDGRLSGETQHQVTLTKGFYIQTTEVTQGQWKAIMGSNPSELGINPSFFTGDDNLPVENVAWNMEGDGYWYGVQAFISKLNAKDEGTYRLPTEAEWEYAARAGTTTAYSFGDNAALLDDYAWFTNNSGGKTHPVAQKQPNPWGLYDMYGNVCEWVWDRDGDSIPDAL